MKPFQRLKVVACFFICISYFTFEGKAFSNSMDTLPPINLHSSTGYRLSITSIKVDKSNSKTAKIIYNLTNAGSNPIKLGKGRNIPKHLIFEFDNSLNVEGMSEHANAIATALSNQKMTLRSGQLLMGNKLKVDLNNSIADLVIVRKTMEESSEEPTPSSEMAVETANNEISEIAPAADDIVEAVKEVEISEDNNPQVETTLPSTIMGTSTPNVETEEIVEVTETPKENIITKMSPLVNTESILLNIPNSTSTLPEIEAVEIEKTVEAPAVEEVEIIEEIKESTEIVEVINYERPQVESPIIDEKIDEVIEPIITESENESMDETEDLADAPHYEVDLEAVAKNKDFLDEDICADLVMESVKIIKQSNNSVTLEYVIANYGNGSAALFGESKKDDDNVAIKAHLSKSRKLTRGSIPLKGTFISKGVKNKSGMLLPKEKVTNTMKIDVSKMTKFTPVLVLSLDGFQDVEECDEFNNTVFINLIEVNKVAYAQPSRPKADTKVLSKVNEEEK